MWFLIMHGGCAEGRPDADRVLDWQVIARQQLQDPDATMTPVPWGVAVNPERGTIYVLDAPNQRVLTFDSTGAFSGQFGRSGPGPGEFREPWALALRPDGNLTILDALAGSVSRWTSSGEWLSAEPSPASFWGPDLADIGDHLVFVATSPTDDPLELKQELVEANDGSTSVLASVSQYQSMVDLPCLSSPMPAPKPVARAPVWTTRGDTIFVTRGGHYLVDVFHDGELVATHRRDIGPVEVTQQMAVERIETGELRIFIARCGVDAAAVAEAMDWQETVSPIERLAVAPDGRIWATRTGSAQAATRIDLLAPDGEYLGTLEGLPAPLAFLSPRRFVGFSQHDEFGATLEIVEIEMN